MPLPAFIQSQIDPAAITKVTRLFNNTLGDILGELIQNARRAGATRVDLTTTDAQGVTWLSVSDDGEGIADPGVILALGRSDWEADIREREDPAGMGIFSLAGRHVEVRSRARADDQSGWSIFIEPDDWENGTPVAVLPVDHPCGTQIRFALDEPSAFRLERNAQSAAEYCPIPVTLNGAVLHREDFLAGAETVVERDGVRIGIFRDPQHRHFKSEINFHGVTVGCNLPAVTEKDRRWRVRVDIVDAPHLQLVLPARKEVVENAGIESLRAVIRHAIYTHIRDLGSHSLSHTQWRNAEDLGIKLPEARPELKMWRPTIADYNSRDPLKTVAIGEDAIIVGKFSTSIEQSASFALENVRGFPDRLVNADDSFAGYSWYDRLARITELCFEFTRDGEAHVYDEEAVPDVDSGSVDDLLLKIEIKGRTDQSLAFPAPVAIIYDEETHYCVEDARIIFTSKEAVKPEELVDLIDASCFCASDDRDSDSWDTQHTRFVTDARDLATTLLLGPDEALVERIRDIIATRAQWLVPEGRRLTAAITAHAVDVQLMPGPAPDITPAPVIS